MSASDIPTTGDDQGKAGRRVRAAAPQLSPGRVRQLWDRWSGRPGGKRVFSFFLGRMVPYTGSITPQIRELREGYARVTMRDRHSLRNHLRSVHAIALANLGEIASGLAVMYTLPAQARGIVTSLAVRYLKKARGTLSAECSCGAFDWRSDNDITVESVIRDGAGDVVARVEVHWRIGPRKR